MSDWIGRFKHWWFFGRHGLIPPMTHDSLDVAHEQQKIQERGLYGLDWKTWKADKERERRADELKSTRLE